MSSLRRHIMMQQGGGGDRPLLAIQGVTSYINTGVQVDSNTAFDLKCSKSAPVNGLLFSGGASAYGANTMIEFQSERFRYGNAWVNTSNWNMQNTLGFLNIDSWVRIYNTPEILYTMNFESLRLQPSHIDFSTSSFTGNSNFQLLLGAIWRSNQVFEENNNVTKRFYYLKIWKSGVLVRDLTPVIRDGVAGLKDTLTDVFYPSEADEPWTPVYA